jgi:hypothetical protein
MNLPGLTEITAQVQAWDAAEFWFWTLAALGFSGLSFVKAFQGLHKSRLLEDTPTSLIRSASQGYIEVEGTGRRLDGDPITAPLTGTACTWWSFSIEVRESHRTGKTRHTRWRTINSGTSDALFELEDSYASCIVDPEGAEVFPSVVKAWRGGSAWPSKRQVGILGRYRYTERRMHAGDPLFVIGYLRTHRAAETTNFAEEVRALLADWKSRQSQLIRSFDTDKDGTLDLREWEKARQVAENQIRREHVDEMRHPGISVIGAPPDDRSFLIAAKSQEQLTRHYRRGAVLAITVFFLLLAVGVSLISMRLG